MTTGVFFHRMFSGEEWIIIGDKFRNFPGVMENTLKKPPVKLFTSQKVTEKLLLKIHTPRFVEDLKRAWYYEGALYSVGGCVEATEKILNGKLENALVFDVAADRHLKHNATLAVFQQRDSESHRQVSRILAVDFFAQSELIDFNYIFCIDPMLIDKILQFQL